MQNCHLEKVNKFTATVNNNGRHEKCTKQPPLSIYLQSTLHTMRNRVRETEERERERETGQIERKLIDAVVQLRAQQQKKSLLQPIEYYVLFVLFCFV